MTAVLVTGGAGHIGSVAPESVAHPPAVIAVTDDVHQLLGWTPQHGSLDRIAADTLAWEGRMARLPSPALTRPMRLPA
ncbi:MAG TPA: hypothetical protein VIL69_07965 [Roseomonas sp.]|jgi:UDP-glucose 4-epimerase